MQSGKFSLLPVLLVLAFSSIATAQYQMQMYGLWHCYDDACSWASGPNMTLSTPTIIGSSTETEITLFIRR